MKKIRRQLTGFLWLLCAAAASAQAPSNLSVITRLFETTIDTLWNRVDIADTVFILQSLDAGSSLNWVMEQAAFTGLSKRHCRVTTTQDDGVAAAFLYYLPSSRIEYSRLQKGKTGRRIETQVFIKLAASNGTVSFMDRLCLAASDTIPSEISKVEDQLWPFTIGSRQRSKRQQWLEFSAAAAATLTVALLFYFYRSQ